MRWLGSFLLAASVALGARSAEACSVCANGAPSLRQSDERTPRFRLALDTKVGEARAGDTRLDDRRVELAFGVSPIDDLELSIDVAALHRTLHESGRKSESAFVAGDLELRATGTLWQDRGATAQRLALVGGTKLPTAPNERDERGRPLSSVLQPGCNAITPNVGVAYALARGFWGFGASASFYLPIAVRTAPHASESFRTTVTLELHPTRWLTARSGFATRYEPSGELSPGIGDPDSGGFVGSTVNELAFTPSPSLSVSAAAYTPVLQALHGRQHLGSTFGGTVTARF